MLTPPPDFLSAIAGMAGAAMTGGPVDFRLIANQLDSLSEVTGHRSLRTLAQGFRELQDEIDNETKVIEHGDC